MGDVSEAFFAIYAHLIVFVLVFQLTLQAWIQFHDFILQFIKCKERYVAIV